MKKQVIVDYDEFNELKEFKTKTLEGLTYSVIQRTFTGIGNLGYDVYYTNDELGKKLTEEIKEHQNKIKILESVNRENECMIARISRMNIFEFLKWKMKWENE